MKLIHMPVLGLILASTAPAADFSPNTLGPLSNTAEYMSYKPLRSSEFRLGLDYVQSTIAAQDRNVERRLNLAVGLPGQTELGYALQNIQEYASDNASRPLGGYAWLRWNMLQSELIQSSITLQYQPGMSTQASAFQASQDRTSLGLDVKLQPLDYVATAVYGSYSRRQNERYQNLRLGTESLVGFRLALGTQNIGIFGDASQRHLKVSDIETGLSKQMFAREWQAGLYAGTESLQISAYTFIPDTNDYTGVAKRGFGASVNVRIGGSAPVASDQNKPEDAIAAVNKSDLAAPAEQPSVVKEAPIKVLETNEMDEFQMLEQKEKKAAKNQKETAAEKAERELILALEQEKKMEALKAAEKEKAKREADVLQAQTIRDNDQKYEGYRDDVNDEINRYTLPDAEELNWNGLNK